MRLVLLEVAGVEEEESKIKKKVRKIDLDGLAGTRKIQRYK